MNLSFSELSKNIELLFVFIIYPREKESVLKTKYNGYKL